MRIRCLVLDLETERQVKHYAHPLNCSLRESDGSAEMPALSGAQLLMYVVAVASAPICVSVLWSWNKFSSVTEDCAAAVNMQSATTSKERIITVAVDTEKGEKTQSQRKIR
jgi:hypothetical protein